MPVPRDPVKFAQTLLELGVTPAAIHEIRTVPFERAKVLLKELKDQAKRAFKRLALELHPDRTGGDADKAAKFAYITSVYREIECLEVRPTPPPTVSPVQFRTVVAQSHPTPITWVRASGRVMFRSGQPTTTSGGTSGNINSAVNVARMRPG